MKTIGLTGGIGSGKSSVARLFTESGIPVLDADQISREVIEPETKGNFQVRDVFGSSVFSDDGGLDRSKFRDYIFKHPDALRELEGIIHPLVVESISQQTSQLKAAGHHLVVLEIPLLIEADLQNLVDHIVVVDLPREQQHLRAMQRDNATAESIDRIMNQQVDRITRLRHADYVVDNSKDLNALKEQVDSLLTQLNA